MLDGLRASEEDGLHLFAVAAHQHRRRVQVTLAAVRVPAEADCDAAEVHRQVEHTALLHCECDLLPRRGAGDVAADDLRQQRQDVHEVLPALRRQVDDLHAPAQALIPDHGSDHVRGACTPFHLEDGDFVVLLLLHDMQLAVGHIHERAPGVGGDHEHEEAHIGRHLPQVRPDHLLDVIWLAMGLVPRVSDCSNGFQVVIVCAIDDGASIVHDDALQINVDLSSLERVP
mmetsp:Transcript_21443/g.69413  ORF Transcript_21443/g.69413 Transcript_21443/m.69413 type:complete len:229 (+) Transcript_21443:940-1626(+)